MKSKKESEKFFIILSPPFPDRDPQLLPMYRYWENGETEVGEDMNEVLYFDTYKKAEKIAVFLATEYRYITGVSKCPENLS
jgi:hypothetical protein